MSREIGQNPAVRGRFPRVSGDEPAFQAPKPRPHLFSPRERG